MNGRRRAESAPGLGDSHLRGLFSAPRPVVGRFIVSTRLHEPYFLGGELKGQDGRLNPMHYLQH